nr:acetylornithine transaminase [Corynebacterium choanae]
MPQSTLVDSWPTLMMDNYGQPPLGITHGSGATLYGEDGRDYVDLLAGIAVCSLGHAHPGVQEAVNKQLGKVAHVSNLFATEPAETVARKLIDRFSQGDSQLANQSRVLFCNSGAEANEAALKLARLTGKRRIFAAHHGFHGRTMGALSLTGQPGKRDIFGPLVGGVEYYPFGDIEYLRKLAAMNPHDVAAIFLEPIQGETGVIPAPEGFLEQLRILCNELDALLIVDEVQTGIGRTGTFFAHQYHGVVPDVVTMAKGLGAGLPIGCCLAQGRAAALFTPGSHGTTFGGNPVVCAAANVVLDSVDDQLLARVSSLGERIVERLSQHSAVVHVRGRGLMLGVQLEEPIAKSVVTACFQEGVIVNAPNETTIRLTPPLTIDDSTLELGLSRLEAALTKSVWAKPTLPAN